MTVVLYALALALVCTFAAVGGRRSPAVAAGLVILQLAAMADAVLDGVALAAGRPGAEVATNLGYLLTSLAVLPITASAVKMDPGRWGSAALAVGCVVLAVVSVRLHATLGPAGG